MVYLFINQSIADVSQKCITGGENAKWALKLTQRNMLCVNSYLHIHVYVSSMLHATVEVSDFLEREKNTKDCSVFFANI